jgi:DNA repair protein RecN (Recombination protein N)
MIRASQKDEPRPVSKIASGGELSRLMLAIKQVVAANDLHMTYLFDEVDAGVSGPTAEKVGRKLKAIGSYHQVVCITHLPQVAAFADAHFLISKEIVPSGPSKGQVKSQVTELKPKERVQELGRMISGEKITAASLTHAREMIKEFSATTLS